MNKTAVTTQTVRPLYAIAQDIRKNWKNPYFGAVPYIEAMQSLDKMTDMYFNDTAKYIVVYFLSNATTWKGDEAKRIKAELKKMAKIK